MNKKSKTKLSEVTREQLAVIFEDLQKTYKACITANQQIQELNKEFTELFAGMVTQELDKTFKPTKKRKK